MVIRMPAGADNDSLHQEQTPIIVGTARFCLIFVPSPAWLSARSSGCSAVGHHGTHSSGRTTAPSGAMGERTSGGIRRWVLVESRSWDEVCREPHPAAARARQPERHQPLSGPHRPTGAGRGAEGEGVEGVSGRGTGITPLRNSRSVNDRWRGRHQPHGRGQLVRGSFCR